MTIMIVMIQYHQRSIIRVVTFSVLLGLSVYQAHPETGSLTAITSTQSEQSAREDTWITLERSLEALSDPATLWGTGIEAAIERAYRECFKTYIIGDTIMTVRMPFAQNNEREALAGTELEVVGKGKADPASLWKEIDLIFESPDFQRFLTVLSDGRDKIIMFDLASRQWSISRDIFDIAGMKAGTYRGMPHRPYVPSDGNGIRETDLYNYLYGVGRIGMDCSGFVWHILSATAREGGVDLGRALIRTLGAQGDEDPSLYVGTRFFDSRSSEVVQVEDQIQYLRPGDVMLFRGSDGRAAHSAIIQSVDLKKGLIRYLQSTDEAPPQTRGVHDSYIAFDPKKTGLRLSDRSLDWSQSRFAPFPGEQSSKFSNDGERYRAYPDLGGGKVVRLRAMEAAIRSIDAKGGR